MSLAGIDLSVLDLVKETTQTTGTGAYELDGPSSGFQSFTSVGDGERVPYVVRFGSDWETGVGTIATGATNTVSRDVILGSSNGGAAVSWTTGVKDIRIDIPADWFALIRPSLVQLQPASDGNDVLLIKNAAGDNRIVGSIAADGSGDLEARNASGTATVEMDGSAGSVTASGAVSGNSVLVNGLSAEPAIAKGWVKFSNTATILASHNVSSISDVATGIFGVNWTTPFASADYAVTTSLLLTSASARISYVRIQTSTAVQVHSFNLTADAPGESNVSHIYVAAFGSQ